MSLKLYYATRTRSGRPRWMLEELGVPYELVRLDPAKKENRAAPYLALHPLGHVPTLVDGETVIYESAAICAWLAERFPEKSMAPRIGHPDRAHYYQWLFFGMATLEPPAMAVVRLARAPEGERDEKALEKERTRLSEVLGVLDQAVKGRKFLVGTSLTAADVVIGHQLGMLTRTGHLDAKRFPQLAAYAAALMERPAFRKAVAD